MIDKIPNQLVPPHVFDSSFFFITDSRNTTFKQIGMQEEDNWWMKTLAERVRTLREERGWKKSELQRAAKIKSPSTLTDIESGKAVHSPQLPAIAKALGVDAHWLKTGLGNQGQQPEQPQLQPINSLSPDMAAVVEAMNSLSPAKRIALMAMIFKEVSGYDESPPNALRTKVG
jgi:transcriptional regulator with XRE-family HTH domain